MSVVLAGLRVLVVEDDVELRNLTQMILEEEGVVIRAAAEGAEALALLEGFDPQVALLDARLPDTTGPELGLELARRAPRCRQVLVSGDSEGVSDWQRGGGLALPKPYEIDELIELVRRAAAARAA
ncbi:response regulator [Vulgatibacter sp.]|uniref:response regulator n=1 Tax=Vulgatibacter sp. TaxID=1971226 RepID=UPI003563D062